MTAVVGLQLCSIGFRAKVLEMRPAFSHEYPGMDDEKGVAEPLSFSPESVQLLMKWGLKHKSPTMGVDVPDLGQHARAIPYRDIRSLGGRLIRREPAEGMCIRAQDLCERIRGAIPPQKLVVDYDCKVLGFVDISWGAACYMTEGRKTAGDLLVGCDGADSIVRKHMLNPGQKDQAIPSGMTQWQGQVLDENSMYAFFDDAIHMYLGSESIVTVHRLPMRLVQWSVTRPSKLDAANALNEWRSMIKTWPVNDDGVVEIPAEQSMMLRESFDLFDAGQSAPICPSTHPSMSRVLRQHAALLAVFPRCPLHLSPLSLYVCSCNVFPTDHFSAYARFPAHASTRGRPSPQTAVGRLTGTN